MQKMVTLSQSKVKTFLRCPKKYSYRYIEGLSPKVPPLTMKRGSWIHECLEYHYKGKDWQRYVLRKLQKQHSSMFEAEREHYGDLPGEVDRIVKGYISHWDDDEWQILAVEKTFGFKLKSGLILKGKMDLVIRDNVGIWVVEHKSNKKLPREAPRIPDPQTTLYNLALRNMGLTGMGTLHNHIRTTPPAVPYVLKRGGLSKARGIDTDFRTYREAIRREGLDPRDYRDVLHRLKRDDRFFRRFRIPWKKTAVKPMMEDYKVIWKLIKTIKRFPRHISSMCESDCFFFDICMIELHGGRAGILKRKKFQKVEGDYG